MTPAERRIQRIRNLTHGGRTLRLEMTMPERNKEQIVALKQVPQNFDQALRNEIVNWAHTTLQNRAIMILQRGKAEANTPNPAWNSYALEQAIRSRIQSDERDYVRLDLSDIPYAALHNKPVGEVTQIGVGKLMHFYWHRRGRWVTTRRGVRKPGRAFLREPIQYIREHISRKIREFIKLLSNSRYDITAKGAHVRGVARIPARARRDAILGR